MADTRGWAEGMRDALRLVKAGKLRSATRAIQAALSARGAHATTSNPAASQQRAYFAALSQPESAAGNAERDGASAASPQNVAPSTQARAILEPFAEPTVEREPPPARDIRVRRWPTPAAPSTPLRYRLFASDAAAGARPLLVMLHGCSQDADDFARGTRAAALANALGWHVVFPEQPARANGARCWNWFRPQDQLAETGEPRALLDVIDQVAATHGVDASRVYVAGLSAGAAMAVILAARFPERIAAVAAHSGLPFAAARDVPGAFAAMRTRGDVAALPAGPFVPLLVLHGDADGTVAPANADALVAQWRGALAAPVAHGVAQERIAGRESRCERWTDGDGRVQIESWRIAGAGHAWSGGDPGGSHTDEHGPDATAIMLRFFAEHSRGA